MTRTGTFIKTASPTVSQSDTAMLSVSTTFKKFRSSTHSARRDELPSTAHKLFKLTVAAEQIHGADTRLVLVLFFLISSHVIVDDRSALHHHSFSGGGGGGGSGDSHGQRQGAGALSKQEILLVVSSGVCSVFLIFSSA